MAKAARAKKTRGVRVDVAIDCTRCLRPVPIEAIEDRARCRACLHELAMPASRWTYVAAEGVASALKGSDDAGHRSTDFADGFTVVTRIREAAPSCAGCGQELIGSLEGESLTCGCGATTAVRPADELTRAIHKHAVGVVGERAPTTIEAVEPVAFACAYCGAAVRTDGTRRAVRCEPCAVDVDVPDALWDALHPVTPRARLIVLVHS